MSSDEEPTPAASSDNVADQDNPAAKLISGFRLEFRIVLWIFLIYPGWIYPILNGIHASRKKGLSPHWMWFGIHPLGGWITYWIISTRKDIPDHLKSTGQVMPGTVFSRNFGVFSGIFGTSWFWIANILIGPPRVWKYEEGLWLPKGGAGEEWGDIWMAWAGLALICAIVSLITNYRNLRSDNSSTKSRNAIVGLLWSGIGFLMVVIPLVVAWPIRPPSH